MSILEDIIEETDITPKKSKPAVKWIVRIAILLISLAFAFGGFKETAIFRLKSFENQVNTNTQEIIEMKKEMKENNTTTINRLNMYEIKIDNNSQRLENHIYSDETYQRNAKQRGNK